MARGATVFQLTGDGQRFSRKEGMMEKFLTRLGGEVYGETSLNGQRKVKVFVSHVNTQHRTTTAEKDFNNQVNR